MEWNDLLNIGSCGLHAIHGAFKTGVKATKWDIEQILRSIWKIFHDSPTQRQTYLRIREWQISWEVCNFTVLDLFCKWVIPHKTRNVLRSQISNKFGWVITYIKKRKILGPNSKPLQSFQKLAWISKILHYGDHLGFHDRKNRQFPSGKFFFQI